MNRRACLPAIVLILACAAVPLNVAAQEPKPADLKADVPALTAMHDVIMPMWHEAWPAKDTAALTKMLPALEKHLEGLSAGEEKSGTIAGDEIAPADELPTLAVPRSHFPADAKIEVGAFFEAKDPHGHPLKLEIRSVDGDQVMARAVHPLAGKDLEFRVKILQVREAPPPVPPRPAALAEDDLIDAPPSKDGSAGKPGG
jgi:hypothetical protein